MKKIKLWKYYRKQFKEMVNKVSLKTKKKKFFIALDMFFCTIIYGTNPRNYYYYGFYEIPRKNRKTFVTYRMSEKIQKRNNNKKSTVFFRDKELFYEKFSSFMQRKVVPSKNINSLQELLDVGEKVIYKPLAGSQGRGIEVYDVANMSEKDFETIKSLPLGVFETFLSQHEGMSKVSKNSVNVVRVVTGRKKDKFSIIATAVVFAKELSFTSGARDAIFCFVDEKTGVIYGNAFDYEGEAVYEHHPSTNIKFDGLQIPCWNEIYTMLEKATKIIPEVGYVGWDVAITPTGPVIIEGNNDPGYEWMQVRHLNPRGIGRKEQYKFLLK